MEADTKIQQHVLSGLQRKPSDNALPRSATTSEKDTMTPAEHVGGIGTFDVELFAESYLKGSLAKAVLERKAMLERGEPLKFFLPFQRGDCAEWSGVDIMIAGVAKERTSRKQETFAVSDRGNGYSSNPPGPLKPGDFGVHSHPDTTKLLKEVPGRT